MRNMTSTQPWVSPVLDIAILTRFSDTFMLLKKERPIKTCAQWRGQCQIVYWQCIRALQWHAMASPVTGNLIVGSATLPGYTQRKTSKPCTAGHALEADGFPTQKACNAERASFLWRWTFFRHEIRPFIYSMDAINTFLSRNICKYINDKTVGNLCQKWLWFMGGNWYGVVT